MKDCHNSANEKPLYFRTLNSSNGLFVYYSLPNFHSLALKEFSFTEEGGGGGGSDNISMWLAMVADLELQFFADLE